MFGRHPARCGRTNVSGNARAGSNATDSHQTGERPYGRPESESLMITRNLWFCETAMRNIELTNNSGAATRNTLLNTHPSV